MIVNRKIENIAIIGNPNSGKTTLFNALTGLRQKVGNYPGVTVEKKEGKIFLTTGEEISILDLPGTYSLTANSPDEKIATDVLLGRVPNIPLPDLIICVVDASNLERNLYLVSQIIDHHFAIIVALNMMDVAEQEGIKINIPALSKELGVPVVRTVASKNIGVRELRAVLSSEIHTSTQLRQWVLPKKVKEEHEELQSMLQATHQLPEPVAFHEAISLLASPYEIDEHKDRYAPEILSHLQKDYEKLDFLGFDRHSVFVEARYQWIKKVCNASVISSQRSSISFSDRIDRVVTHRVWGFVIFFALMALMFQTIFSWANLPMELISEGFAWLGIQVGKIIPPGDLHDLIINGAIAGVGAVVAFLPQILFLLLCRLRQIPTVLVIHLWLKVPCP